ncbi:ABC transporter permease [Amycolatopsis sp. GM8]|uniref:galactan export ABC transporter permease subunit Wzm/RfbD n=1 Tax=Amycolatopsis sp. GM8 TaxID=2896530 RepID=UPI001F1DD96A|nr:ABC transporter permease [Amycolatopsis sp. GM8]
MHATSTVDKASDHATDSPRRVPPSANSRSFARAFEDIREGFSQRELWSHLGWQDIKQRYRRSVIGPFWITISQGVISLGLGILYSTLWGLHVSTFLPYIATGFIVWTFVSGCLAEGMETFISNEGLIKQIRAPLTVYMLRTVWRQTLMFAHNIIVVVIIVAIFFGSLNNHYDLNHGVCGPETIICHPGLGWYSLSAIPAFALLAINAGWLTLLLGIISTRFRDIPQLINSIIQLLFYMTPIVWPIDQLYGTGARAELARWVVPIVHLNPFYHFVQILRAPLIGQAVSFGSWLVVIGITIVGWALALVALRNYRARVSYWV